MSRLEKQNGSISLLYHACTAGSHECGHSGVIGGIVSRPLPDFLYDMDKLHNQAVVWLPMEGL